MVKRWPIKEEGDASILNEKIHFPTSQRVAKNRLLKPPMTESMSSWDPNDIRKSGIPTQKAINIYEKWGLGGFGMCITGNIFVDPKHMEAHGNSLIHPSIDTHERKNAFKRCANVLQGDGVLAIAQLNHAGRLTPITFNEQPWAPSSIQHQAKINFLGKHGVPKELGKSDIQDEIIPLFVYAAKYCYEAGFNGVQIHAAFGYLLSEFLTTNTNKRTDEYGGTIENRARIIKEIYQAIRKEIPKETGFIIGTKVNTHEFGNNEFASDDVLKFCQEFDKYGFDFIELSGGTVEEAILNYDKMRESSKLREAFFQEYSKQIKPAVKDIKLYLTGGLRSVYGMTDVINSGVADGVGIGRPSMAEPDIATKILTKQVQSVAYNTMEANYIFYSMSSVAQLNEAASTSVEEAHGNLTYGISDYSCPHRAFFFKVTFSLKMIPTMIKKSIFG